ncbi:putative serine dehydratase domain-containing protein [Zychaea mexicana]|uniref:putative serine dehydratase domain-containing protein n=1 Tax=Zychaea mexicana TaxID=64656 RepID=UPI0022FE6DA3|nr:putative serine dehydratase domain-containing protein [Zychaea mexicana]KAI9497020.1 putative serine dehydratase domain-containing protein [Zychaea mexicana]
MTISTTTPLLPFYSAVAEQQEQLRQAMVGKRISELRTPTLVIDRTVFKRNCERLGNIKAQHNVKVRVHVKSHKAVEGAALQLEGAKTEAIVVSTMAEAHRMVSSKLVLLGFPITPDKFAEAFALAEQVEAFQIFIAAPAHNQKKIGVFIKIDCGYGRAGVPLDSAFEKEAILNLAKRLATSSCATLHGLYAHAGHSYKARSAEEALTYLEQECNSARQFQALFLEEAGIDIPYLSIGATPTVQAIVHHDSSERVSKALQGISEVHAGAYSLLDRQQMATGLCTEQDVAISVACRVASRYPDRNTTLIDGGALAFSKDTAPQGGFGVTTTGVVLQSVSQEHGILASSSSSSPAAQQHVGDIVRVLPNHCCLAAACHLYYLIVENGNDQVVDVWFPVRGW